MRARRLPPELLLAVALSVVGAVDGLVDQAFDTTIVFVIVGALCLAGPLRAASGRDRVAVRADLAGWLEATAAEHGEQPGDLADRAIGAFRAGLVHDPRDGDARPPMP